MLNNCFKSIDRCGYLVLKAGDTEVEEIQQAVELGHWQVREPLLQHQLICVLQHPQQTDKQAAAGLGREAPMLTTRLEKTNSAARELYQKIPALCRNFLQWKENYLRVEQEAVWSGHWGCSGGACYCHGNSLIDYTAAFSLCLFSTVPNWCPLGTPWPTPLVVRL